MWYATPPATAGAAGDDPLWVFVHDLVSRPALAAVIVTSPGSFSELPLSAPAAVQASGVSAEAGSGVPASTRPSTAASRVAASAMSLRSPRRAAGRAVVAVAGGTVLTRSPFRQGR
jgi:hypothetical protein